MRMRDLVEVEPEVGAPARPQIYSGLVRGRRMRDAESGAKEVGKLRTRDGYIDTHLREPLVEENVFMWDSAFILLFARYGRRTFDFQRTLDNLYASQHPDGFICREIGTFDGKDRFERFDAASTGPNVIPWTEWEHYGDTADSDRLGRVFPVLVSYHRWLRRHRTWRNGTYWTSGLGSGMDNQPRFPQRPPGEIGWPERLTYHGHAVWIDACLQQILSADLLLRMADALGRSGDV